MSSSAGGVPQNDPRRWHLWYDNYDEGTVFITQGERMMDEQPVVIAEGLPYKEGFEMVFRHNTELAGGYIKDDSPQKET